MIWHRISRFVPLVGGVATLLLALLIAVSPRAQPVAGQASVPCYMIQGGATFVAGAGCEWEMQSGATLDIQSGVAASISDLTVSDDLTVADNATVSGTLTIVEQVLATGDVRTGTDVQVAQVLRVVPNAAISVTNGAAFTPTGTFQPLTSFGTVTPTITETDADAGDILVLMVTSATTINIADTGTTKLSAAWAGGQYDTLTLMAEGDNWVEIARSNN